MPGTNDHDVSLSPSTNVGATTCAEGKRSGYAEIVESRGPFRVAWTDQPNVAVTELFEVPLVRQAFESAVPAAEFTRQSQGAGRVADGVQDLDRPVRADQGA
jgi:hypothetical protein